MYGFAPLASVQGCSSSAPVASLTLAGVNPDGAYHVGTLTLGAGVAPPPPEPKPLARINSMALPSLPSLPSAPASPRAPIPMSPVDDASAPRDDDLALEAVGEEMTALQVGRLALGDQPAAHCREGA